MLGSQIISELMNLYCLILLHNNLKYLQNIIIIICPLYISWISVIFAFIFNDTKSMNVCRAGLMFEGLCSVPFYSEKVRLGSALWRTNIIAAWRRTCIRGNKVSTVIMTGSLPARRYGIWSANEWTRRTKGWLVRSCISVSSVNKLWLCI